ncbi:hypothetical protein EVAR_61647_1 [Eumeta japonica]|uniref:Uncharacterized protein n=1 Tax=Eumeta variegata TaxID=151549 RepID=A0A4C1Z8T9_EUMVA|nr:hypothetical protein EVAR_61647_1 [Eumeta japonica]
MLYIACGLERKNDFGVPQPKGDNSSLDEIGLVPYKANEKVSSTDNRVENRVTASKTRPNRVRRSCAPARRPAADIRFGRHGIDGVRRPVSIFARRFLAFLAFPENGPPSAGVWSCMCFRKIFRSSLALRDGVYKRKLIVILAHYVMTVCRFIVKMG